MFPLSPPVDLYETRDFYVLNAELPGVRVEDVHVEAHGSQLVIWGERRMENCCPEENYHRLEGIRGRFQRTFSLPEPIPADCQVQATLKNGVLHVEIPKPHRRIHVQSGEGR